MLASKQIAFGKGGGVKSYKAEVEYIRNEAEALYKGSYLAFPNYIPQLDDDFTLQLANATTVAGGYGLFGIMRQEWRRHYFGFYSGQFWIGEKQGRVTSLDADQITEVRYVNRIGSVNGGVGVDFSDATEEPTKPFLLFGLGIQVVSYPGYNTEFDFKRLKVKRNGEDFLDVIPVIDLDGVPCAYDKVSGEFFYSADANYGFTAGPEI